MRTWRQVAVGAGVLVGLSIAAYLAIGLLLPVAPAETEDRRPAVFWQTEVVTLAADSFVIEAGGRRFSGAGGGVRVHSDPGDLRYWTLELEWFEQGLEQRLYLYFAADDRAWWIGEIRTYDGGPGNGAEWASFPPGPYARSPIGTAWVGDLDVLGAGRVGPVRLHLGGVALRVGPKEGYAARADGGIPLPPGSTPFSSDGPLHCSGILETTPADAHSTLLELGYRVSWRVAVGTWAEWRTQVLPPAGVIAAYTPVVGIDGAIVIAVVPVDHPDASVVPRPADCPAPS